MSYRHRATKPSSVLWMLIVLGNVALIVASAGVLAVVAFGSILTVAVAAVGGALLLRRGAATQPMSLPVAARRRA
ncbi:hypothetical protein O7627_29030 [Solwaraspora sp. WMMD1047]|uniref:hypothetical protein n=1 Tax=Solwaraspora sp. WMMD1047 TaxID=3016102 RepID=UPI002417F8F5|nr:hypothetical protein [Solwaraspora sp. WMMD1047]MDG4833320.1 hypothetical protein [Solwaraspora sp. WMMD1047]